MGDQPDPITNEWFLVKSMKPPVLILCLYAWFVLKAGPHFMKDRKPFVLQKIVLIYNLLLVAANIYIAMLEIPILSRYNFRCQPTDFSTTPEAMNVRYTMWYYYALKYIELLDTVFFVLRKKQNQVTFLHVFHHIVTPLYSGTVLKYQPGGHSVLITFLNTAVHIVMYSYYGIAALGPQYRKYLWWKRYVTIMQLIQFTILLVHSGQLYFIDCDYPMWVVHSHVAIAVTFLYLFGSFYVKTYLDAKRNVITGNEGVKVK